MSQATRDIFWARNEHQRAEIEAEAESMLTMYQEGRWGFLSPALRFVWCVAAERSLTAQSIERARLRLAGK